jgi:hypothetical protein
LKYFIDKPVPQSADLRSGQSAKPTITHHPAGPQQESAGKIFRIQIYINQIDQVLPVISMVKRRPPLMEDNEAILLCKLSA